MRMLTLLFAIIVGPLAHAQYEVRSIKLMPSQSECGPSQMLDLFLREHRKEKAKSQKKIDELLKGATAEERQAAEALVKWVDDALGNVRKEALREDAKPMVSVEAFFKKEILVPAAELGEHLGEGKIEIKPSLKAGQFVRIPAVPVTIVFYGAKYCNAEIGDKHDVRENVMGLMHRYFGEKVN